MLDLNELTLYLIQENLLQFPILYLSDYIIKNKSNYYKALKSVTERQDWETWILYVLDAIETTSQKTLSLIQKIYLAQQETLNEIREKAPEICSKEFVELLFEQPYCKISFLIERNIAKKQTASKYLKKLCDIGILDMIKRGRENYYINLKLWELLAKDR